MTGQYLVSKKYHEISVFAEETAKQVSKNKEEWMKYLTTAARLYQYPFEDQMLIYAQIFGLCSGDFALPTAWMALLLTAAFQSRCAATFCGVYLLWKGESISHLPSNFCIDESGNRAELCLALKGYAII